MSSVEREENVVQGKNKLPGENFDPAQIALARKCFAVT